MDIHSKQGLALAVLFCTLIFVTACVGLPSAPADYIKDVVGYKEGIDGIVVYFVLADKTGAETTSSGKAYLRIVEESGGVLSPKTTVTLYERRVDIERSKFFKAKVGMGAFERERVIYSFGRISYDEFTKKPSGEILALGKIILEFVTEGGRTLRGEASVIF